MAPTDFTVHYLKRSENPFLVKTDIKSLNLLELENLIKEMGEPKFRASQIFKWLQSGVESFDEMTDISLKLRERLKENCYRILCK